MHLSQKLTLLPRRCIYRKIDRVPTKGKLEAAGFLPLLALFCLTKLGFACEALALSSRAAVALCGFRTPCAYVCTVRQYLVLRLSPPPYALVDIWAILLSYAKEATREKPPRWEEEEEK